MNKILENFKNNWLNLKNEKEKKIYQKFAEKGRELTILISGNHFLYSKNEKIMEKNFEFNVILVVILLPLFGLLFLPLVPRLLDVIVPLNHSRPLERPITVEYSFSSDEYYWPIYFHNSLSCYFLIVTVLAVDCYFVMIVQNAISMFVVLGYGF